MVRTKGNDCLEVTEGSIVRQCSGYMEQSKAGTYIQTFRATSSFGWLEIAGDSHKQIGSEISQKPCSASPLVIENNF